MNNCGSFPGWKYFAKQQIQLGNHGTHFKVLICAITPEEGEYIIYKWAFQHRDKPEFIKQCVVSRKLE